MTEDHQLSPGRATTGAPRNFGLDAARALAIWLVLISHFAHVLQALGLVGVELFFALSGYLVGGIFLDTVVMIPESPGQRLVRFWQRRWWRTLPNYWLFVIVYAVIALAQGKSLSVRDVGGYAFFLQNFFSPLPWLFTVSWSLAVEEWFYLLFPLVALGIGYGLGNRMRGFIGALLLFSSIPLALRLLAPPPGLWNYGVRMVVVYRLDAMMFGVACAWCHRVRPEWWRRMALLPGRALGFFLVAMGTLVLAPQMESTGTSPAIAVSLSAVPAGMALLLPWFSRWRLPGKRISSSVESMSRWSYSAYLVHIPILWLAQHLGEPPETSALGRLLFRGAALVVVVAISAGLYRFFEQPLLRRAPASSTTLTRRRNLVEPL